MKFRDALDFFTGMVFVIISVRFFFLLILTKSINYNPMMYHVIPYINVIFSLVIPMILNNVSHSDCHSKSKLNHV